MPEKLRQFLEKSKLETRLYWRKLWKIPISLIAYDTVTGAGDITLHVPKRRRYPVQVIYRTAMESEINEIVYPGSKLYIGNKKDSEIDKVIKQVATELLLRHQEAESQTISSPA